MVIMNQLGRTVSHQQNNRKKKGMESRISTGNSGLRTVVVSRGKGAREEDELEEKAKGEQDCGKRVPLSGDQNRRRHHKNNRGASETLGKAVELEEPRNKEREVCNFFWADGRAIIDYAYFGDVVSFDTTFQTNQYEMSFAPLFGMNHHKQTVVFGAALLFDETTESFVWLLETFMIVMSKKQPCTIFTYQSIAISNAIKLVLLDTCHRLCLWHIFQNAATHLSQVIHTHPKFVHDFKSCIYDSSSMKIFLDKWNKLMVTYNLFDNSWLQKKFKLREKWATIYHRESFCAYMTTMQRSESMNAQFKRFFKKKLSISEFIGQYHQALELFRKKEVYEDFKSRQTKPVGRPWILAMLKDAADYMMKIWTKYSKDEVGSNVQHPTLDDSGKEEIKSLYARTCQKVFTLTIKSASCRVALEYLDKTFDKAIEEVEELLRNFIIEDVDSEVKIK
ncbi:protein FAR1-RELATED SEQUENCE 5-like [Canna indica]|uniref:Protein FAR1-RELATED SEQUENCE n=1 Tax=Canna indica TaxID=4628 RepID=A0AAQ3JW84_9LILI|nr:protein FAR1-RELATED SEQUENCE 5-like [Canna indica]